MLWAKKQQLPIACFIVVSWSTYLNIFAISVRQKREKNFNNLVEMKMQYVQKYLDTIILPRISKQNISMVLLPLLPSLLGGLSARLQSLSVGICGYLAQEH